MPILPEELVLQILSHLDYRDVLRATRVSKQWHRVATAPVLWRTLYFKQGWNVNEEVVRAFEQWSQTATRTMRISSAGDGQLQRTITEVLPAPFDPVHIAPYPDVHNLRLNWQYLYRQHLILDKNWRTGNTSVYEIPTDQDRSNQRVQGIYCLQFDAKRVVSGSRDRHLRVWDIESRECVMCLSGHTGSVLCLQFDGKTDTVVTGSSDTTIMTWDLLRGERTHVYEGHQAPVLNVRFDENYVVSCSKDKTIKIWARSEVSRHPHTCIRTLRGHRAAVNAVQFVGKTVVSASGDRTIKIWDLDSGDCLRSIEGHERGIACIVFDGRFITSGSSDLSIRIHDAHTGSHVETLLGHSELVRTIQTDERKIVSGSYDMTIKIWNKNARIEDEKVIEIGRHHSRIFKLQFDEKRIVSCSQDSQILVWDFSIDVDDTFF